MSQEVNLKPGPITAACRKLFTNSVKKQWQELKDLVRLQYNARLYYPEDDINFFRYRKNFVFFEPPVTDSTGYIRKDVICLECFKKEQTELRLLKSSKIGLYNHLRDKHITAFRASQKLKEPVVKDIEGNVLTQNGNIKKKAGRKRKSYTNTNIGSVPQVIENFNDYIPKQRFINRRKVDEKSEVIDSFAIGATVKLPFQSHDLNLLSLFNLNNQSDADSSATETLDDSARIKQEKCDLLLVHMSLSMNSKSFAKFIDNTLFQKFIAALKNKGQTPALTYRLPNSKRVEYLKLKLTNFLFKTFKNKLKIAQLNSESVTLITSLRSLSKHAGLHSNTKVLRLDISFMNKETNIQEAWSIFESCFEEKQNCSLNLIKTVINVFTALSINPNNINHLYLDLIPTDSSSSSMNNINKIKQYLPKLKFIATAINLILSNIVSVYINLTKQFASYQAWVYTTLNRLNPEVFGSLVAVSNTAKEQHFYFSLEFVLLLKDMIEKKTSLMLAAEKVNRNVVNTALANWKITEEIFAMFQPFVTILELTDKPYFAQGYLIPYLVYIEKYLSQGSFIVRHNIDGVEKVQSVVLSSQVAIEIHFQLLQSVRQYIKRVEITTELDHFLLFTALDPRTKDFLSSTLCPNLLNSKARDLLSSVVSSGSRNKLSVTREIMTYLKLPSDTPTLTSTFDFSSYFSKILERNNSFYWFEQHRTKVPNVYDTAIKFLSCSFVFQNELRINQSNRQILQRQGEKQNESAISDVSIIADNGNINFLRNNWSQITDKNNFKGFRSALAAIDFHLINELNSDVKINNVYARNMKKFLVFDKILDPVVIDVNPATSYSVHPTQKTSQTQNRVIAPKQTLLQNSNTTLSMPILAPKLLPGETTNLNLSNINQIQYTQIPAKKMNLPTTTSSTTKLPQSQPRLVTPTKHKTNTTSKRITHTPPSQHITRSKSKQLASEAKALT